MKNKADDQAAQLAILHDLAIILEESENLASTLDAALKLMAEGLGMMRGAITLISPGSGQIRIEAAYGLNAVQRRRGSYAPGEGITGRVIESGQPMCIADVGQEPLFLNKTRSRDLAREKISFICVPIRLNGQTVGAISVDQLSARRDVLENELRLLRIIAALLAHAAYERQECMLDDAVDRPRGFVGNSEIMRQVYEQIAVVAPSMTTVFLQGESGTGKELAARAIHAASQRARGPFVSLNCAALPENLIESELFGHERGAFTGAVQTRKGRFEMAREGSLFLDEIGELSLLTQAKLLRILQERTFERLGGMETLKADVRIIAATNRDLAKMVEEGGFRRDLYYRLNVFPVYLPPLREREEDILPIAAAFLQRFASGAGKKTPRISFAAMDLLQAYSWPGNIRELQNVMERAMLLIGRGNLLLPQHLPASMRGGGAAGDLPGKKARGQTASLQSRLDEVERAAITDALDVSEGHINRAAAMLGLTERVLGLRLKKFGINYRLFRKNNTAAGAQ